MRILIAWASGPIERALLRRLSGNQHDLFALTLSPDSAPTLKEIRAEPVIADALDAAAVKAAVGRIRPDAVISGLPRQFTVELRRKLRVRLRTSLRITESS